MYQLCPFVTGRHHVRNMSVLKALGMESIHNGKLCLGKLGKTTENMTWNTVNQS